MTTALHAPRSKRWIPAGRGDSVTDAALRPSPLARTVLRGTALVTGLVSIGWLIAVTLTGPRASAELTLVLMAVASLAVLSLLVPPSGLRTARFATGAAAAFFGATLTVAISIDLGGDGLRIFSAATVAPALLALVATGSAAAHADFRLADLAANEAERRHAELLEAVRTARAPRSPLRSAIAVAVAIAAIRSIRARHRQPNSLTTTPPPSR